MRLINSNNPTQITLDESKDYNIDFYSTDNANNQETIKTIFARIDLNQPELIITDTNNTLITGDKNTYDLNYLIKFSATDEHSLVKEYYIREDNQNFSKTTDLNYNIIGSIGTSKTIHLLAEDNAQNQRVFIFTIKFLDSILGDLNSINASGVTDLNITIGGNDINNNFQGIHLIEIFDGEDKITEFDHNFSSSDLNLNRIRIIKENNGVIVDLNGQLQNDQNKTLYLENNNFVSLCVKNAPLTSINEISSTCTDANEYNFTQCLTNGSYSIAGIDCNLISGTIIVNNLKYSGILGTPQTQTSSSGSSCIAQWSCSSWSNCVDGIQNRTCTQVNLCNSPFGKPIETQACTQEGPIVDPCLNINCNDNNHCTTDSCNNGICSNTLIPNCGTTQPETKGPVDENKEETFSIREPTTTNTPIDYSLIILLIILIILIICGITYYKKESILKILKK